MAGKHRVASFLSGKVRVLLEIKLMDIDSNNCFPGASTTFIHWEGLLPPKTNMSSRKWDYSNWNYIFQPLISRGHVSFPGSKLQKVLNIWRISLNESKGSEGQKQNLRETNIYTPGKLR